MTPLAIDLVKASGLAMRPFRLYDLWQRHPPKAAPRSWGEFGMARPLFDLRGRGIDLRVPLSLNAATEVAMSLFEVLSSVLLSIAANQDAGT